MPTYSNPVFAGTNWGDSSSMPSWTPARHRIAGAPGPGATGVSSTPTGAATATRESNLSGSRDITAISDLINSINRSAQKTALQNRIPGAAGLENQSSANIKAELAGQVDPDTERLLQQQAAERGIGTGTGALGPNASAAYLRALGLTSIGQKQLGQQNLSSAYARNPAAPIFDPTSQLLTPAQGAQLNLGYISEADRAAEEQQRLALEAARGLGGGSRGGGGYGYGGPMEPVNYGITEPAEVVYGYNGPNTGATLGSTQPFDWLASLGNYIPAGPPGSGTTTFGYM